MFVTAQDCKFTQVKASQVGVLKVVLKFKTTLKGKIYRNSGPVPWMLLNPVLKISKPSPTKPVIVKLSFERKQQRFFLSAPSKEYSPHIGPGNISPSKVPMSDKNDVGTQDRIGAAQSKPVAPKKNENNFSSNKSSESPFGLTGIQRSYVESVPYPKSACPDEESLVLPHFERYRIVTPSPTPPYLCPVQTLPSIPDLQATIPPLFQDSNVGVLKPSYSFRHLQNPCSQQSFRSCAYKRKGLLGKRSSGPLPALRHSHSSNVQENRFQNIRTSSCVNPVKSYCGDSHSGSAGLLLEQNTQQSGQILPSICLPPLSWHTFSNQNELPILPPLSSSMLAIPSCIPKQTRLETKIQSQSLRPLTFEETNLTKNTDMEQASQHAFRREDLQFSRKLSGNLSHKTSSGEVENLSLFSEEADKAEPASNHDSNIWKPGLFKSNETFMVPSSVKKIDSATENHNEFQPSFLYAPFTFHKAPSGLPSLPLSNEGEQYSSPQDIVAGRIKYPRSLLARVRKLEHVIQEHSCNPAGQGNTTQSEFATYHKALYQKSYPVDWGVQQIVMSSFGYPSEDSDVNSHLFDVPGLSGENAEILSISLKRHLSYMRRTAECSVEEAHRLLKEHSVFRNVTRTEIIRLYRRVVCSFCEARKQVVSKFGCYARNRKWIENIVTKQRRGCLTYPQNNILRLWLFRNFANPYPGMEDKEALVKQSGLSVTQVNNWLINARSRIWKPTIDAMLWKDSERLCCSSSDSLEKTDITP